MNNPGRPGISLIGGMTISNGATKYGTLGLVTGRVVGKDEKVGFLTAGHVLGGPKSLVESTNIVIGTVELNPYLDEKFLVDVAFVEIAVGIGYGEQRTIQISPQEILQITEHVNIPLEKQEVIMQGARSGMKKGVVSYPQVDITFEGTVLKNVCLATYESDPGDSGAAVFYINDQQKKTASWVGIHGGKIVYKQQTYSWFTPLQTIETVFELW